MAIQTLSADLIADIYAAAVGRGELAALANIVSTAMGVDSTGLWVIEEGRIVDMATSAVLRETEKPYLAHFHRLDPWQQASLGHLDRVVLGSELFSERQLVKTEFYNDFARPAGLYRPMGATVRLAPGVLAVFGIEQPGTRLLFEPEDKRPLQRMMPHLRRALQLRLTQRKSTPRGQLHAAALDALAFGVVVCEATGRIVLANTAAEGLARAGAGIILGHRGKALGATVGTEARALAALVHDAANNGPGGVIRLSGRTGGAELVALVTPLPREFGLAGGAACALVTLRSIWDNPSFSTDALIALFGMSSAQAEIALAIYNGKAPDEIAVARGVSISTVRTHLSEIFARTSAENQRDLVRLLGTLPPVRAQSETR